MLTKTVVAVLILRYMNQVFANFFVEVLRKGVYSFSCNKGYSHT
jgi:hypothetical protein